MRDVLLRIGIDPAIPAAEPHLNIVVDEVRSSLAATSWQLGRLLDPLLPGEADALQHCARAGKSRMDAAQKTIYSRDTMITIARERVKQVT